MNDTIFLPSDINSTVKVVKSRLKNVFNHFSPVKGVFIFCFFGVNFYFNE